MAKPAGPLGPVHLLLTLLVRLLSAAVNTIHDCDEVFNFWEPLHFQLYGNGLQTWEHSPRFALRSYLYLQLHTAAALPGRLLFDSAAGKRAAFRLLRALLGAACAAAEVVLCAAVARAGGRRLGLLLWALLLTSSGLFTASTTFLPSTFTMLFFAWGASLSLDGRRKAAVCVCVLGGLVGWPFAGLAAVPLGLQALLSAGILPTLTVALLAAAAALLPSLALDTAFYGRLTLSAWNLVKYNVVGGESGRYGTEGPLFYLLNLFNSFNLALILALVAPLAEVFCALAARRRPRLPLLVVLSSFHLWLGAMSSIPHKEERFMYVIYPQLCLGAALSLDVLCELGASPVVRRLTSQGRPAAAAVAALLTSGIALLSAFRSAAVIGNYNAPMRVFAQLPAGAGPATVCMGAEWYRFPSSFFLPGEEYRLGFVKSGFDGMLPMPFNATAGGTAFAPLALNDENREMPEQYVASPEVECSFWVGLEGEAPPGGAEGWTPLSEAPFLDASRSPALWRAFHVPVLSARRNRYTSFRLLGRAPPSASPEYR